MKSFASLMIAASALLLATAVAPSVFAMADGETTADDRKENVGLLEYTVVQNALGLDESQKKEIANVNKMLDDSVPDPDSIRELPAHQREAELHAWETKAEQLKAKLSDVLTAKQVRRLKEIALQLRLKIRASTLLAEKSLSEKLSLSSQQIKDLENIRESIQQQIGKARKALMKAGSQTGKISEEKVEQFRAEFRSLRGEAYKKAMNLLTPEQKEKLSKLTGKAADINLEELLAEQSARVEKWTNRWRNQSGTAGQSSQEHPVGTTAEDPENNQ